MSELSARRPGDEAQPAHMSDPKEAARTNLVSFNFVFIYRTLLPASSGLNWQKACFPHQMGLRSGIDESIPALQRTAEGSIGRTHHGNVPILYAKHSTRDRAGETPLKIIRFSLLAF